MSFILRITAQSDEPIKFPRSFYVVDFEEQLHISTLRSEAQKFDSAQAALEWWNNKDMRNKYKIEVLEDK